MKILQLKSTFKGLMTTALTALFLLTTLWSFVTAQTISEFIAGGEYYIDHIGSNKRLQSNGTGTDLITTNITDTSERSQWKFKDAGNGLVYIDCVSNNKRMQGMSDEFSDESAVRLDANSFAGNWVKWKLVPAGNNNWFLENKGHNTRLTVTSNAEIAFGNTAWDGPYVQWKITKKSTGETFSLNNFTPTNTTKLGSNAEVKLNFNKAVNLGTANTIDVYIDKVLSNNKCTWSLGSSKELKVKHNAGWPAGSLVTILIKPTTKSASEASFNSGRKEYEFIVDTSKDFGFKRETISSIATRNNGTHNIPLKVAFPTNRSNKVPVHIWVHGGGWNGGTLAASVASQSPHSKYLAEELGIATLEIAYRCLGSNGTFTMAMEDVKSAYQWAIDNASKYNFDLSKIFISGGSAGTPLAALFAQRQNKIKAFIGFNGIYNFVDNPQSAFPYASSAVYEYANPSRSANSAFFNLRSNPPATLLLHGDADATINHTQSTKFATRVNAKGSSGKAVIYPQEEHGFFNLDRVQYEDCLWEMAHFLKNNNMVQSNPPQNGAEFYIDHIGSNKRLKSNGADTDLSTVNIADTGVRSHWKLVDAGNGYYYIQCVANGKRLQGTSSTLSDGSSVQLSPATNAGDWVQWKLIPAGNNNYFLQNKGHNARLFVTSNAQVAFGDTAWDGPYVQWKVTNRSTNVSYRESPEFDVLSSKINLKLYPNPVKDYLQIQLYEQVEDAVITLFDVHGKLILTQTISKATETSIDVSKLVSGSYFIRIQSGDAVETQKLLKY